MRCVGDDEQFALRQQVGEPPRPACRHDRIAAAADDQSRCIDRRYVFFNGVFERLPQRSPTARESRATVIAARDLFQRRRSLARAVDANTPNLLVQRARRGIDAGRLKNDRYDSLGTVTHELCDDLTSERMSDHGHTLELQGSDAALDGPRKLHDRERFTRCAAAEAWQITCIHVKPRRKPVRSRNDAVGSHERRPWTNKMAARTPSPHVRT